VKKFFVIPLMFLYLLAVSGVMINAHYCGENLESLSLNTNSSCCDDDACDDQSPKEDNCCKDKIISAKLTNEQITTSALILKLSHTDYYLPSPSFYISVNNTIPVAQAKTSEYFSNAPPGRWQNLPLYKLYQQLVIYS